MIKNAGYDHYEISNCALSGYKSRHNMKYWSYDEYVGIGLGASSFVDGSRYKNCSKMCDYIKAIKENAMPIDINSVENYTKREEMGIFVFTGLRKSEGISLEEFRRTFKENFFDVYGKNILNKYRGLLILTGDRLYLTEQGMDISNSIMMEFL